MKYMIPSSSPSSSSSFLLISLLTATTWNPEYSKLLPSIEDSATTTSSSSTTTTTFVTAAFIGGGRCCREYHHHHHHHHANICRIYSTSGTTKFGGGIVVARHHDFDNDDVENEHEGEVDTTFGLFQHERQRLKQQRCHHDENIQSTRMIQYSRKDFYSAVISATATTTTWASIMPYPSIAEAAAAAPTANDATTTTTKMCQNGALIPETSVPGAYNSICMNLPQRELVFPPYNSNNGKDANNSIRVTIQQLTSGSGKTGMAVWNSGLLLSRLLVAIATYNEDFANWWKTIPCIFELGCGAGLTSIVCSKLGAPYVIATDGNVDVLQLTKSNIKLNRDSNVDADDDQSRNNSNDNVIETKELSWGLLNAMDYNEMANVIIGSDLTYNSGTWNVLAETMATILKDDGIVIYLSLGHDGFNVRAELDEGFLSVAKSYGLLPVSKLTIPTSISTSSSSSEETSTTESTTTTTSSISLDQLLDQVITPNERQQVLQPSGGARVVILQKKSYLMKQQKKKQMQLQQ